MFDPPKSNIELVPNCTMEAPNRALGVSLFNTGRGWFLEAHWPLASSKTSALSISEAAGVRPPIATTLNILRVYFPHKLNAVKLILLLSASWE